MTNLRRFRLLIDYLVYLIARIFDFIITRIPESWAFAFGRVVGRFVYVFMPDRRAAALENLTIAFGKDHDEAWIQEITRRNFEHLGLLLVEFLLIRNWSITKMAERIEFCGSDPFNLLMSPGNHGILLLNSHFGCFEVSAATTKYLGMKTHLIATALKNPFLSKYVFSRAGKESSIYTYPHKGSAKKLIELMNEGCLVACLADQRGDAERGIFVDYFGTPAPANEIFARMAIDGNARILPLYTYRVAPGRYKSTFEPEITFQLTGDMKKDLTDISQVFHDHFAEWLRIAPEQGFWVHRKWKRAPSKKRNSYIRRIKSRFSKSKRVSADKN